MREACPWNAFAVDSDVLYEVADRKGEGNVTIKVTTSEGSASKEVAWEVE